MNLYAEEEINNLYNKVKSQITGGKIFGEEVREYDLRTLIVAAYLLGMFDQTNLMCAKEQRKEIINDHRT